MLKGFAVGLLAAALACQTAVAVAADSLEAVAERQAAIIELMHGRASRALVTAAQDQSFKDYFSATDPAQRQALRRVIEENLAAVQRDFRAAEMCLIDVSGAEVARVVRGEIAADLDPDETDAVFFEPAFALADRRVHISELYVSPDTDGVVVAYVTPILLNNNKVGLLHYEHGIPLYQRALSLEPVDDADVAVIVVAGDKVIADSRWYSAEANSSGTGPGATFKDFSLGGIALDEMMRRLGGVVRGYGVLGGSGGTYEVAYKSVDGWTVVAFRQHTTVVAGPPSDVAAD